MVERLEAARQCLNPIPAVVVAPLAAIPPVVLVVLSYSVVVWAHHVVKVVDT